MTPRLVATGAFQPTFDLSKRTASSSNGTERQPHKLDHRSAQVEEMSCVIYPIDIDKCAARPKSVPASSKYSY
jgi:hypothetical protein